MGADLPLELLRTLVAVADVGTLNRASARVHRTPSALSLQMSKLEGLAGVNLFERQGRNLILTPAGTMLVAHARDILDRHDEALFALKGASRSGRARLGLIQDFVDPSLSVILARLRECHPHAQIEVRIAGSGDLRRAMNEGELDVAIVVDTLRATKPFRVEPMVWLGNPERITPGTLPLVLAAPPCPFSDVAFAALTASGRRHYTTLQTPSLSGLHAAIAAGLGIGCRTRLFAAGKLDTLGMDVGLPSLPDVGYALLRGRKPSAAAQSLAEITEDTVMALPA